MLQNFTIQENEFLSIPTAGYYHTYYTGYNQPDNPNFLNTLKNTFNNTSDIDLNSAKSQVIRILTEDIPLIMKENHWVNCICVGIPRAKALQTYTEKQLYLRKAISEAISQINGIYDGTTFIERHMNTKTTHLSSTTGRVTRSGQVNENDGSSPYSGITEDTCHIARKHIKNQNIILVDDIYTIRTNIDEDCIQALYNAEAKQVVFYAVAYTKRGYI